MSATPGTTRDIVDQHIQIDGLPLRLSDTAGLRDAADDVEHEGVLRARAAMQQADRILVVVDDSRDVDLQVLMTRLPPGVPATVVRNKIDLSRRQAGTVTTPMAVEVAISVLTGAGLGCLKEHLKQSVGYETAGEATFIARRRHLDALNRARERVLMGKQLLVQQRAGELVAEELRLAQQSLSAITGEYTSDDLLGRIFSTFCIGK